MAGFYCSWCSFYSVSSCLVSLFSFATFSTFSSRCYRSRSPAVCCVRATLQHFLINPPSRSLKREIKLSSRYKNNLINMIIILLTWHLLKHWACQRAALRRRMMLSPQHHHRCQTLHNTHAQFPDETFKIISPASFPGQEVIQYQSKIRRLVKMLF